MQDKLRTCKSTGFRISGKRLAMGIKVMVTDDNKLIIYIID